MDQTMNNDTEYLEAANAKLDAIEAWADEALPDADVSRQGNVLTLQLEGGNEIVLNLQTPWHEIWPRAAMKSYSICRRLGMKFGWLRVSEATISANATASGTTRARTRRSRKSSKRP